MTYEELEKIENGTLLKIKGNGFFGKVDRIIYFDKENLFTSKNETIGKGYLLGSTLYPVEWLKLATKRDYEKRVEKIEEEYTRSIAHLKEGFAKAEKARKDLK